jgi:hypothetical protein
MIQGINALSPSVSPSERRIEMARTTDDNLDAMFQAVVDSARACGVNVEGWSFGRHFSNSYVILDPSREIGTTVSRSWATKREAWEGMNDMVQAFRQVLMVKD